MAIVKDYYNGPTHIMIDDTYCRDKTSEEIKEILAEVAAKAYPILLRQHMEKLKKGEIQNNTDNNEWINEKTN